MTIAIPSALAPEDEKKICSIIEELGQYAAILNSDSRNSVNISCVKYEVLVAGRALNQIGGVNLLAWALQQVNDSTNEIASEWKKLILNSK